MKFKEKLYKFMYGRNGVDQYGRFLLYTSLIIFIIGSFFSNVLQIIGIAMLIYAYYRTFSKKLEKRREENGKYLRCKYKLTSSFRNWKERNSQRKDYCFFRCPGCKAMLRVPRGKGKIRVTCRKCGAAFERKT